MTGQTADLVGNPYPSQQVPERYLDAKAFAQPANGKYGNLGYNNLRGPGQVSLDMALTRSFPLRERMRVDLRAEAFNLPNHTNLGTPVNTLNSGTFGQIQTAGDPRIMQLAPKLQF